MKLTMLLADAAEAIKGKLYILGGGWSLIGPNPGPMAIAIKIEVPWNEANISHNLRLELLDADDQPVLVPTPTGDQAFVIHSTFEAGRPQGLPTGKSLDVALAINIAPLPLRPDSQYVWCCYINDETSANWRASFWTRADPNSQRKTG